MVLVSREISNAWVARSEERIMAQEAMNSRHLDSERRAASSRSWKKAILFQAAFPTSETDRSRVMGRYSPAALAALFDAASSKKMAKITPELRTALSRIPVLSDHF